MTQETELDKSLLPDLSRPKSPAEYARIFFTGFAMGSADIVPGVSGGTMAFILGVYETLLNGIKSFNFDAIKMVLDFFSKKEDKPTVMQIVDHLHLRFLIALGFGILAAIFALSSLLEGWLETQPTFVFAFFGGLIIASILSIGLKVKWSIGAIVSLAIGGIIAFFLTDPTLGTLGDTFGHSAPVLFVSGMIAICAMILPGISGSFILLILGQYQFILNAVKEFDILSITSVAAGCAVGIVAFSRVLSWLLKHYENTTIALLVGFMVGSMRLILFRITTLVHELEDGTREFEAINLDGSQIGIAVGLAVFGFLVVSLLDHLQTGTNPVFSLFWRKQTEVTA